MTKHSTRPIPAVDPAAIAAAHEPTGEGGRIWRLGDDIDTDVLAPGRYMAQGLEVLAAHCLGQVRAEFATHVRAGDIVVAGDRFGIGSSREQAAAVLRHLGIAAIIAPSFAGLFYRNAINLGLPALVFPNTQALHDGNRARLNLNEAILTLTSDGTAVGGERLPGFLLDIINAGGLLPTLKARLAADRRTEAC